MRPTPSRSDYPTGWLAGVVVVGFVGTVGSILLSVVEAKFAQVAWVELHAVQTFGAYLAWLIGLVPVALVASRIDVGVLPSRWLMSHTRIALCDVALWAGASSVILWLRGHGALFVAESDLGAFLAWLTVCYPRAAAWQVKRKWRRLQTSAGGE